MTKFKGSIVINETDKEVQIVSLPKNVDPRKSVWKIGRDETRIAINLDEMANANVESIGDHRMDFTIVDEDQYGVFSVWTEWNKLFYSITPGDYVSAEQFLVLDFDGQTAKPLLPEEAANTVIEFRVRILDKHQIEVAANLQVVVKA